MVRALGLPFTYFDAIRIGFIGSFFGLFAFGILTKFQIKDNLAWVVAFVSIILSFGITLLPETIIGKYQFHWEILPLNGLITFIGLYLIKRK